MHPAMSLHSNLKKGAVVNNLKTLDKNLPQQKGTPFMPYSKSLFSTKEEQKKTNDSESDAKKSTASSIAATQIENDKPKK